MTGAGDATIAVVDYHKGNLLSVARSADDVGATVELTDDPARIEAADGIILPGVGAFEDAMTYLRTSGQECAIRTAVGRGVPFLGICLGLHLLLERGNEARDGWVDGLGLMRGQATRLPDTRLKVPHVGWDQVHLTERGAACPLFSGVPEGANLYFTHSFAADAMDSAQVAGYTHYGRSFPSVVWEGSVFGVQFHPEKSSGVGLRILHNFVNVVRAARDAS